MTTVVPAFDRWLLASQFNLPNSGPLTYQDFQLMSAVSLHFVNERVEQADRAFP
jgi:hypothetical protein